jgi:hypothetical protein
MTSWYESRIDRQIREAQERGEFDNLPGAGKPLPTGGEDYDEEWWIKGLARREGLAAALPPALALRREVEDLPGVLARRTSERLVREHLADLNERIVRARRGPVEGPPVTVNPVDVEAVVSAWRSARARA